jgi:hypothetical protein
MKNGGQPFQLWLFHRIFSMEVDANLMNLPMHGLTGGRQFFNAPAGKPDMILFRRVALSIQDVDKLAAIDQFADTMVIIP